MPGIALAGAQDTETVEGAVLNISVNADLILTLERSGQFSVRYTEDNTNQCGPTRLTDILTYRVKLTMSADTLDENGFVVDNMFVDRYFKETYRLVPVFESCEKIAIRTCRDMRKALGSRLLGVEVSIAGMKEAVLTARCTFGAFAGE